MSSKPFLVGLTGSIGMGKTTTAGMFADEGIPVWDADATVHRLYQVGGAAVDLIRQLNSSVVVNDVVDRAVLKHWISEDPGALGKIEGIVHPLVAADRRRFIEDTKSKVAVLDIPLLFETGGEKDVDIVVVVSAPYDIQRKRVLRRGNMCATQFAALLAQQLPDSEKRARADYVIETENLESTRAAVQSCVREIRARLGNA